MPTSYKELVEQRKALDLQIDAARKNELASSIAQVRELVEQYGLTSADVFPKKNARGAGSRIKGTVPPKFRDPASGATWSGRGKPPVWIKDQERDKFLIAN